MTVKVETFEPNPDHGRPVILELSVKGVGKLAVHVRRDDGSLWLYPAGPSGGERGNVVLPTRWHAKLAEWLANGEGLHASPGGGTVSWGEFRDDGSRALTVRAAGRSHGPRGGLSLVLDPPAIVAFIGCLQAWVDHAAVA